MLVAEELVRRGGVATRAALIRATSRRQVDAAVAAGLVLRPARGRYVVAQADEARVAAHALSGTLCLASAALHWGWAVKTIPERPQVTVPKNRKVDPRRTAGVDLRRLTLGPDDIVDGVTGQDRTLLDCLRHLPFDESLAIADSALRSGYSPSRLRAMVRDARGTGGGRMRRVADLATADSANPFESALRAIALGVSGLTVRPQVAIRDDGIFLARPDLVDEDLRIVLEADSFEWHGGRADLRKDARRYNALAVRGWLVLRFSWEDVMFEPELVRSTLERAVAGRTRSRCEACPTAA
ncbi:DUF559 domain-containing protein [Nocardioides montaniterrae]